MILLIFFLFVSVNAIPFNYKTDPICGYKSCPKTKSDGINIHIVAHSHDDVGWLKTVNQYYYGTVYMYNHVYITSTSVKKILDSVIQALLLHSDRRFIYVETAFFYKWWQEQDAEIKEQVRYLVENGQLEFAGGAWSMNDEATTNYQSIIDQFTWGFRILNDTLGPCARPRIGWQIDPFGHSRETASLFSQFGFDGLFFSRLDYRDRFRRHKNKSNEIIWQGSQSLGANSQIFTSILHDDYVSPSGFCFDIMCFDRIEDDKNSKYYNADKKALRFINDSVTKNKKYKTNNLLITMGGDFHYQDALSYFKSMDILIKTIRDNYSKPNIFYSTPSCYLKAVHEANLKWAVKTDDFLPYASNQYSYWTGYYTSRPTLKRFERLGNHILQVTKQLSALAFPYNFEATSNLNPLREAMGVMQHHDAITGTSKQHVAHDYARMLNVAIDSSLELAGKSLKKLIGQENIQFKSCLLLNISQCEPTENNNEFLITVYNPLSRPVTHYVRLPVTKDNYEVSNANGTIIDTQMVPIFEMIRKIPGRTSNATKELIFKAENIPALGYKFFLVKMNPNKVVTSNEKLKNQFGFKLRDIRFIHETTSLKGSQEFLFYKSEFNTQPSGAYVFRPKVQNATKVSNKIYFIEKQNGSLVTELRYKFRNWAGAILRIYPDKNYIECVWIIGPIPVRDKVGKEIITRFTFKYKNKNLNTTRIFYTDSNGKEMIQRIRNKRFDYNLTKGEPISQNYYPITSKITLKDEKNNIQVSILNDRAQGGSSLEDGKIELMIHRRILNDDGFGVEEALNEIAFGTGLVAIGTHYITINEINSVTKPNAEVIEKELVKEIFLSPWIFISPLNKSKDNNTEFIQQLYKFEKSGLKTSLPSNVQILTLEPWTTNKILLRLEHILEESDDLKISFPVTVNLENLFSTFEFKEIQEMTLGANHLKSTLTRLIWRAQNENIDNEKQKRSDKNEMKITLKPMEIRTFIIEVF